MSSISIIGAGKMARAIGGRAVEGGNAVEIIGRDAAEAASLAESLGGGATVGKFGVVPAGDIVILAVPSASAAQVAAGYGEALAGKVVIDITNAFTQDAAGLTTTDGTSIAQEVAKAAPATARVIKAFNTLFGHVLAKGGELDVLLAGDDDQAKADTAAFIRSLRLRPWDVGPLAMAHSLEHAGLIMMGLGRHGGAGYDFALGVNILG